MNKTKFLPVLLLMLITSGCASPFVFQPTIEPTTSEPILKENEVSVTFLRQSLTGYAVFADLYEIYEDGTIHNIGTSLYNTKLRYITTAGKHIFAVRGEIVNFLIADLEAGKHYYVEVTPTMGVLSARFELTPVSGQKLSTTGVQNNISKLKTMESDINMILPFYPKWLEFDDSKKVKLTSESASHTLY